MSSDVVVVGAGLAGLTCARELERGGLHVVVLEKSDAIGGRVRTDHVDGFRCDRGFQLINPAYPALQQLVDVDALDLRTFAAGAALAGPRGFAIVADPRRSPGYLPQVMRSGYVRPGEIARFGAWAKPSLGSVRKLLEQQDEPLATSLDSAGVRGKIRAEVFEPFFTGVLAEDRGETSATFARLLIRSFALGTPGVPALGMSALPEQIAADLEGEVVLGAEVASVETRRDGWQVVTDGRRYDASAVVVATDPAVATGLTGVDTAGMKGLVTYWYAVDEAPSDLDLLVLDPSRSGPVVNTAVMSNVAPAYAPEGRHLVQATTLAQGAVPSESEVREHLSRMYRTSTAGWDLVVAHEIPHALPHQRPGVSLRQPVELGEGLFVAGDHRDTASIQGALVSGRRTAAAVRLELSARRGRRH
ncbi:MAG TPA: NAD(P)/FAD-dependent oxidoreductase [Nocardioidaceae bacterium]|nr:NAD(P)/FAD-dependent oxidoreductase [Nocardioidaceae bacterium]